MEKSPPTRQKLLALKAQYGSFKKGLELLKSKREALMKEFFGAVHENLRMREALAELLTKGRRRLELTRALSGDDALESFSTGVKRDITLDITMRNIWGVNVPEVREQTLTRTMEARDVSPVGERSGVIDVARDFEAAGTEILKIASRETRLTRIGEMIRADTRKINALTEVMLPYMRRNIKSIERVLDEREREEVFRLKRYKKMREGL